MIKNIIQFNGNNNKLFSKSSIIYNNSSLKAYKSNNVNKPLINNSQQQHINKPSISKEDSLFQIFEKYQFNKIQQLKEQQSTQTIWLPFLKTQNYNFNPLVTAEKDKYHESFDLKLLETFKQSLTKELRLLNKNESTNSVGGGEKDNIFKIEKSLLITENHNNNNNNKNNNNSNNNKSTFIESSNDFLDIDKLKPLTKQFNSSLHSMNQIQQNNNFNQSLVWAQQVLPNCFRIRRSPNTSNSELALECFNYLYPILSYLQYIVGDKFKYTIHSITNCREDDFNEDELKLKIRKIRKLVESNIQSTRKRLYKCQLQVPSKDTIGITNENIVNLNGLEEYKESGLFVIQLLLTSETNDLYISVGKSNHQEGKGWSFPIPYPQGVVPIERDIIPPSRAYKKLIESFQLLGAVPAPGCKIVELGGSPGGWTSILNRLYDHDTTLPKFEIHSIDRSKLDSQFNQQSNIHQYIGNGTKWLPPFITENSSNNNNNDSSPSSPVEWLLNDMAIAPKQSLETLEKWISNKYTKYFIWAIKFTGDQEYKSTISDCFKLMEKYNIKDYKVKHLIYQGNEIMLMGKIY